MIAKKDFEETKEKIKGQDEVIAKLKTEIEG